VSDDMKKKKSKECPNCGNKSLEFFMDRWVCNECEYHSKKPTKIVKKSFR